VRKANVLKRRFVYLTIHSFLLCPSALGPKSNKPKWQLWGAPTEYGWNLGYRGGELTILRAYISAVSWPTSHLAPDLQHQNVDRFYYAPYAAEDYTGFLLDPPAPVYDQARYVPVDEYARFFRESFWQNEFTRFGHQALKLVPTQNALMVMRPRGGRLVRQELIRELGHKDYNYFCNNVIPVL
jgi:hypothetical protein